MNYFLKTMFLSLLFHTTLNIQCENDDIPSFGLTDDPDTSYFAIQRNSERLKFVFAIPEPYGYIKETPLTTNVKLKYLRQWNSKPDYARTNEPYKNVYNLVDKQVKYLNNSQLDRNLINTSLTFLDSRNNVLFTDQYKLEFDEYDDCLFVLKVKLPNVKSSLSYLMTITSKDSKNLDFIIQVYNRQTTLGKLDKILYSFSPFELPTNLKIQIHGAQAGLQQNYSAQNIIKEENLQIDSFLEPYKQTYVERRDAYGNIRPDFLRKKVNDLEVIQIPKWSCMDQKYIPLYEYFQFQDIRKFYQFTIPRQQVQNNDDKEVNLMVGFYIFTDDQNKLNVVAARNIQTPQWEVSYLQDTINFDQIQKVVVTYKYFENNFPSTSTFDFARDDFSEGFQDIHILMRELNLEYYEQQNDDEDQEFKVIVVQERKEQTLDLTIMFGLEKIIENKKKLLQKRQKYQISSMSSFEFEPQFGEDLTSMQKKQDQIQVSSLTQQLKKIYGVESKAQIWGMFQQQNAKQKQSNTQDNGQQMNVQQLQYYQIAVDIQQTEEPVIKIKDFNDTNLTKECYIVPHIRQQIQDNDQQLTFKIVQQQDEDDEIVVDLQNSYLGNSNDDIIYPFLPSKLQQLNMDLLQQQFCSVKIIENQVELQFGRVKTGFIFIQSTINDTANNQIHFRQDLYVIINHQFATHQFIEQQIPYNSWKNLDQHQYLMIEKYINGDYTQKSKLFQNLKEQSNYVQYYQMSQQQMPQLIQNVSIRNTNIVDASQRQYVLTQISMFEEQFYGQVYYAMLGYRDFIVVFRYDFKLQSHEIIRQKGQHGKTMVIYQDNDREEDIFKNEYLSTIFIDYKELTDQEREFSQFETLVAYQGIEKTILFFYSKDYASKNYIFTVDQYQEKTNNSQGNQVKKQYVDMHLIKLQKLQGREIMLDKIGEDEIFYNQTKSLRSKAQKIKFDIKYQPLNGEFEKLQNFSIRKHRKGQFHIFLIDGSKQKISRHLDFQLESEFNQSQDQNKPSTQTLSLTFVEKNARVVIQLIQYYLIEIFKFHFFTRNCSIEKIKIVAILNVNKKIQKRF